MSDKIKVLLIKPMKPPEIAEIPSNLKGLQATVGGYIEAIYPYEDPVALVCNEEGKINGLPLNRALRDTDGHIYDIVAGDFFICDVSGEDFGSLSDEQIEKYSDKFKTPERFLRTDNGIAAVPFVPPVKRSNDAR